MDMGGNYISALIDQATDSLKYGKLDSYGKKIQSAAESGNTDPKTIKEAAQALESQFLSQLMGFMFNTVEVDSLMGGGFAEETLRSMMVDEYGGILAKSGGIGIADQIQKSLMNMQMTNNTNTI